MVANSGAAPQIPKPPGRPVQTCDLPPTHRPDKVRSGGGGSELTVTELEAMAVRQQEEMANQRQLLVAKEQRLRYLKEHEVRHAQVAQEQDRLRRLRDRVEAQELKLTKLRALRGQLDHNKSNNHTLTSDLDSIRALFNEKEKELTMAVAKVEELTRQLEDVRRGRQNQPPAAPASQELERLRRELMYRNKLNEQQSLRLNEQREVLCQRQIEMASIDKRIGELQDRLHRKRLLNQQLANQINQAASSSKAVHHTNRVPLSGMQQQVLGNGGNQMMRTVPTGNIAAVEPYHHVPTYPSPDKDFHAQTEIIKPDQNLRGYTVPSQDDMMGPRKQSLTAPAVHHYVQETKQQKDQQQLSSHLVGSSPSEPADAYSFGPSKSDPKYQTLPYNTKFTGALPHHTSQPQPHPAATGKLTSSKRATAEGVDNFTDNLEFSKSNNNNVNSNNLNLLNNNVNHNQLVGRMPVHSGSKGLSTALTHQKHQPSSSPTSSTSSYSSTSHLGARVFGNNVLGSSLLRGQPVGGTSSTTSSTSSLATSSSASSSQIPGTSGALSGRTSAATRLALPPTPLISDTQMSIPQKPTNTVQPTPLPHLSTIYQTSSTKILPVQPQKVNSTSQPPQLSFKEESDVIKPALPPKPAMPIKPTPPPPPRQSHSSVEVTTSEHPDTGLTVLRASTDEPPPLPTTDPPPDDSTLKRYPEFKAKARPPAVTNQSDSEHLRFRGVTPTHNRDDRKSQNEESQSKPTEDDQTSKRGTASDDSDEAAQGPRTSRRIEMPPEFLFPESAAPPADLVTGSGNQSPSEDQTDRSAITEDSDVSDTNPGNDAVPRRTKKGNLKGSNEKQPLSRRVSFDPLALLLDASLEGELELVMRTAGQVRDPSAANDEGITALHNAICAGHFEIVTFLVKFGCDVNAQDSDGWTPLHCAASCNNVSMVRFLVEHGACIFATTLSDHETAAEKCEEDEEGFDGCSEYLYSVQEKLGIMNNGAVFAVFGYEAHNSDELNFEEGDKLIVLRKGDEWEREWWWARINDKEGYVPRNLLGLYPRVHPNYSSE